MPETYKLAELDLARRSEIHRFFKQCPDIIFVRFYDGEVIVQEGDAGNDIYLILMGSYVVEKSHENPAGTKPAILATVTSDLGNPSFVGEMAYFGACLRTATVRSSMCTHACRLKPWHLDVILDHFPVLTRVICRQFTDRLKNTSEQLRIYQEQRSMKAEQVFKNAGEIVVKKGEKAEVLYPLVLGKLKNEETGEVIVPESTVSGFVEASAYFRGGIYSSNLTAVDHSLLVAIDSGSKLAAIRNFPELVLKLCEQAGP